MKVGDRVTCGVYNIYNGTVTDYTTETDGQSYYLVLWDTIDFAEDSISLKHNPCWMSPTSIRISKEQIRQDKLNQLL